MAHITNDAIKFIREARNSATLKTAFFDNEEKIYDRDGNEILVTEFIERRTADFRDMWIVGMLDAALAEITK